MIWQNPWGWAGLAAIALPILIHLLGQGRARRQRFPTLRFFGQTRPLPTSRTRLHDLLLLAVRIAILAAAVAAIAKPLRLTGPRQRTANETLNRAVIIDAGASMDRLTPGGESARRVAERTATALADSAATHVLLVGDAPSRAIPGAIEWLARQGGRGELIVVSDFQADVLTARDLEIVPAPVAIRFERVAVAAHTGPIETRFAHASGELLAQTTPAAATTDIVWTVNPDKSTAMQRNVVALAGPDEAAGATAAALAARSIAVPVPLDSMRAVALVYPHATERTVILSNIKPLHTDWMVDVVAALSRDSLLIAAAASATVVDSTGAQSTFVVTRNRSGLRVVVAGEALVNGRDRLVLLPLTDAGSLTSAALIAATGRALSISPPVAELDPSFAPDSALKSWQRTGATIGTIVSTADTDESDGRWFWLAALVLLGVETLLRRLGRQNAPQLVTDAGT